MMEERRQARPGRHRACDLSIRGESVDSAPVHPASTHPSGYGRRTGEMDADACGRACAQTAQATKTRACNKAPKTCRRGSGHRRESERNIRDFDASLRDDTGRAISTKTPVAKMTAPPWMIRRPAGRADSADAKKSSAKSQEVAAAVAGKREANAMDVNNDSSNKLKSPVAEMIAPTSTVTTPAAVSTSGAKKSSEKSEDLEEIAASGLDENNSSNKSKTPPTAKPTTSTPVVKPASSADLVSRSDKNSSSNKSKDHHGIAAVKNRANGSDANNSSNKSDAQATKTKAPTSKVAAADKPRAGRSSKSRISRESKGDGDDIPVVKKLSQSKVELEMEAASSAYQEPEERRRRSPSLQVPYSYRVSAYSYV